MRLTPFPPLGGDIPLRPAKFKGQHAGQVLSIPTRRTLVSLGPHWNLGVVVVVDEARATDAQQPKGPTNRRR